MLPIGTLIGAAVLVAIALNETMALIRDYRQRKRYKRAAQLCATLPNKGVLQVPWQDPELELLAHSGLWVHRGNRK